MDDIKALWNEVSHSLLSRVDGLTKSPTATQIRQSRKRENVSAHHRIDFLRKPHRPSQLVLWRP